MNAGLVVHFHRLKSRFYPIQHQVLCYSFIPFLLFVSFVIQLNVCSESVLDIMVEKAVFCWHYLLLDKDLNNDSHHVEVCNRMDNKATLAPAETETELLV